MIDTQGKTGIVLVYDVAFWTTRGRGKTLLWFAGY